MTTDHDVDPTLARLVSQFFAETSGQEIVTRAEAEGLNSQLWESTEELGFPLVGIDDARGGSGGSLLDLVVLLQAAGRYAVPLPLAETSLAAWLLSSSGQDVSPGPMTVVPGTARDTLTLRGGTLSGVAHEVPWARGAKCIVALLDDESDSPQVVSIDPSALTVRPGADLAGMPRDVIDADDVPVESTPWDRSKDTLFLRGALLRSALMAGALEGILEITRQYVSERVQFGRPVGAFQSVQQHVVTLAQMAAMSTLTVQLAGRAALTGEASFDACSAKLILNQNSALGVRAAHQAHGAIGMTQEYRLQQLTRRLNGWRGEFGDEQGLALRIGAAVARRGGLARVITSVGGTVGV